MKKVLFIAIVALCAMGCCKKADGKCCKGEEKQCCQQEQVVEEAAPAEAAADTAVVEVVEVVEQVAE